MYNALLIYKATAILGSGWVFLTSGSVMTRGDCSFVDFMSSLQVKINSTLLQIYVFGRERTIKSRVFAYIVDYLYVP